MRNHNVWRGGTGTGTGDDIPWIGPSYAPSPRFESKKKPKPAEDNPDMLRGTIAKYIRDREFGFISRDDGEGDVWFHRDAFPQGTQIRRGQVVSFELNRDIRTGKTKAVNAKVVL